LIKKNDENTKKNRKTRFSKNQISSSLKKTSIYQNYKRF